MRPIYMEFGQRVEYLVHLKSVSAIVDFPFSFKDMMISCQWYANTAIFKFNNS